MKSQDATVAESPAAPEERTPDVLGRVSDGPEVKPPDTKPSSNTLDVPDETRTELEPEDSEGDVPVSQIHTPTNRSDIVPTPSREIESDDVGRGSFEESTPLAIQALDPIGDEDIEGETSSVARRGKVLAVLALVAVFGVWIVSSGDEGSEAEIPPESAAAQTQAEPESETESSAVVPTTVVEREVAQDEEQDDEVVEPEVGLLEEQNAEQVNENEDPSPAPAESAPPAMLASYQVTEHCPPGYQSIDPQNVDDLFDVGPIYGSGLNGETCHPDYSISGDGNGLGGTASLPAAFSARTYTPVPPVSLGAVVRTNPAVKEEWCAIPVSATVRVFGSSSYGPLPITGWRVTYLKPDAPYGENHRYTGTTAAGEVVKSIVIPSQLSGDHDGTETIQLENLGCDVGYFAISPELDETRAFAMSFRLDNAEIQVLENTDSSEPN